MAYDSLILGGFEFTDFSVPSHMMSGGDQAMIVHKLPGGSRVIDTLGPDEAEISWHGQFYGDSAYDDALLVDAMRAAGKAVSLVWGGTYRTVIIKRFIYIARRLPVWLEYEICCEVYSNPSLGATASVSYSTDTLVSGDLSVAASISTSGVSVSVSF